MQTWRTGRQIFRSTRNKSSLQQPCRAQHVLSGATRIVDILSQEQSHEVTVKAFVRTIRKQRRRAFAELDDGSSFRSLQAILDPALAEELSTGAAVSVTGQWRPSPSGKEQSWELEASKVELLGENDAANYPVQKKYQTQEFLRTLPHLRTRIPQNALLLRLRSEVISAVTLFFEQRGFVQTHTPIITSSDCEGAGEVFEVAPVDKSEHEKIDGGTQKHFFKEAKYLTVSSQLHLEALALSVGRVWTLSPTFRAERSDTARHLSEFYMLEAEMAFTDELEDVMTVVEDMIRAIAGHVKRSRTGQELVGSSGHRHSDEEGSGVDIQARLDGLTAAGRWVRIPYHEAVQTLQRAAEQGKVQFRSAPDAEEGLQTEHERFLADSVGQGKAVFVTDYPQGQKPFYMAPSKTPNKAGAPPTVACFDLLLPEMCEVAGGSMREHRLEELQQAMQVRGLAAQGQGSSLDWYQDLRRYGSVSHGGFGLGFDRLLCYLSGVSNIRDIVTFPRWHGRCSS